MKIEEFKQRLGDQLRALDHPEIVAVEPRGETHPHVLLRVDYANGASSAVQVQAVRGPGIPKHTPYEIPREAF